MHTLTITIADKHEQREMSAAVAYACGMTGCVEENVNVNINDNVRNDYGSHQNNHHDNDHDNRHNNQLVKLTYYFDDDTCAKSAAMSLAENLSINIDDIHHGFVDDKQDWNAKWRESMEPVMIADGVWVSPTWLEPPVRHYDVWIKIEPKMAFGTGHHETTRLAAQTVIKNKDRIINKKVLDIGTGSGVLCFVADHVGAALSVGIEIDRVCLENLAENLRDNGSIGGNINFVIGPLDCICANDDHRTQQIFGDDDHQQQRQKFDAVIMNMLITESAPLFGQIVAMINDSALLVWSGILDAERDDAINAAKNFDFVLTDEQIENEWWCGTFLYRQHVS